MQRFAVINLDRGEGPAHLGYDAATGTIWCERLDGVRWDTCIPVKSLEDAAKTASKIWDNYWWGYKEVQND